MSHSSEKQHRHKQQAESKKGSCLRSGGSLKSEKCCFKEAEYNFCHKTRHFANVYFAAKRQKEVQQKQRHKSHVLDCKNVYITVEGAVMTQESEPLYSVQDTIVQRMHTL